MVQYMRVEDLGKVEGFDWDEGNIDKNMQKHSVDYRECEEVFFNRPRLLLHDHKHSQTEQRFALLGVTNQGRRLTIVFTIRSNRIRVISARDQNHRAERGLFEQRGK